MFSRLGPLPSTAAIIVIVIAALVYFGSYLGYWFNPHDEGGTTALIAQRMLNGERPYTEIEIGYNLLWFWPVCGLFKVFGTNYLVMRGWFFFLSTVTAVIGYLLTRHLTGRSWLALGVGLILVVFPGSQFKNYVPLIAVANTAALMAVFGSRVEGLRALSVRAAIGGAVLGLSYLTRIEFSHLFAFLWIGLLLLRLFVAGRGWFERARETVCMGGAALSVVLLLHIPVYAVASAGGYSDQWVREYGMWLRDLGQRVSAVAVPSGGEPSVRSDNGPTTEQRAPDRSTKPRMTLGKALKDGRKNREWDPMRLFIMTYLPAVFCGVGALVAGGIVLLRLPTRTLAQDDPALRSLILIGGALTTFGSFFFFRPDRPHLSEFMPAYLICLAVLPVLWAPAIPSARLRIGVLGVIVLISVIQLGIYGWVALDHPSAGTVVARSGKRTLLEGENGVRVRLGKKEHAHLDGVRRAILAHSKPGDWLVCYPYQPGYNLMTNRPTYEKNLYIDNATHPVGWSSQAIRRFETRAPAVVVIDDRAINAVEASRFSNWAQPVYAWLIANYRLVGEFDGGQTKVFARPAAPSP